MCCGLGGWITQISAPESATLSRSDERGYSPVAENSAIRFSVFELDLESRPEPPAQFLASNAQTEGDRVRVSLQLIAVDNQAHLWASSYDRGRSDILLVQADIARAVTQQIGLTLTPQAQGSGLYSYSAASHTPPWLPSG